MSYESIIRHRSMAMDEVRNAAYSQALRDVIRPDSIVLDLGSGLGTLGMLAAKLGARRVYLVEPTDVVSLSRDLVKRNGLEDRVTVLQGRIEEIELPEKVDVITSVMTGNFLLSEDLLPSLFHARQHYLKPEGVLIPSEAVMEVMPVSLPDYYEKHVASWGQEHMGLSFAAGQEAAANNLYWSGSDFRTAEPLAPAGDLMSLDLRRATTTHCDASADFVIQTKGVLHGWLGWFRMRLGKEWLSTSPFAPRVHWGSAFLPLAEPLQVKPDDRMTFSLLRPPSGDWTWTTKTDKGSFRQSTFFGTALTPATLRALGNDARPALSPLGTAVQDVLAAMDGTRSLDDLATLLQNRHPVVFSSHAAALASVRKLVKRHGKGK